MISFFRIGAMFGDIARALLQRPATQLYPRERHPVPARLRGALQFDPARCSGCGVCAKDCPANALDVITIDKKAKRFVLRYHVDRCTFCAQCVESCNYDCLKMSSEAWELAAANKQAFTLLLGNQNDVESVAAGTGTNSVAAATT
jgi:formate hydrogenlyase subunit 6/NADH:ubiquinone oxidoreductase subunit I